jgi:CubicO group peptidase (beta-lactamase class C family)
MAGFPCRAPHGCARVLAVVALALAAGCAFAPDAPVARDAPDDLKLGRAQGYPVGTARTWFTDESVRVGSFSAQGEIPGIANGRAHTLAPAARPMPLPRAKAEPAYRWRIGNEPDLTIDGYLARQRVMGLIIVKDGVVQVERYQYERTPQHRFTSMSMAKSITSLAVGMALAEGRIASLDDKAAKYVPSLKGTLVGGTSIRHLLRMASGARFTEEYDGRDDSARFNGAMIQGGIEKALATVATREAPAGTKFSYASVNTHALSAVLKGATGMTLSQYLEPRLWQAIGAETSALWRADRTGLEMAGGHFNATLRDYARLAIVLANDGKRPDLPGQPPLVPIDYLMDATDWHRVPPAFRPGKATPYYGYGYQFWLFPGERRRFALLGVYGQMIFVDPQAKLVMVQVAANATPKSGRTTLAKEADAFWRGVVAHYGAW